MREYFINDNTGVIGCIEAPEGYTIADYIKDCQMKGVEYDNPEELYMKPGRIIMYAIIDVNLDEIDEGFKESENGGDFIYNTLYTSPDAMEIIKKLDELKATDDKYSVEEYRADDEGEFIDGSNYDSPTTFKARKRRIK